ncbi:MAG: BfmA/BtgA family mobilization protein [Bacteroidota bacterium]
MNGVIAILKDIEKSQTKPTVARMQSLFEEAEPKKKPLISIPLIPA